MAPAIHNEQEVMSRMYGRLGTGVCEYQSGGSLGAVDGEKARHQGGRAIPEGLRKHL